MLVLRAVFVLPRSGRGRGGEMWGVAGYGLFGDKYDTYADSNVTSILGLLGDKKLGSGCG